MMMMMMMMMMTIIDAVYRPSIIRECMYRVPIFRCFSLVLLQKIANDYRFLCSAILVNLLFDPQTKSDVATTSFRRNLRAV